MKVNSWGKTYEVKVREEKYVNGGTALVMDYLDDEFNCWMPFAHLTVNLDCRLNYGFAYVDTNNCPWAEDFIREYELGEPTGKMCASGYCVYPLYAFAMNKIKGRA